MATTYARVPETGVAWVVEQVGARTHTSRSARPRGHRRVGCRALHHPLLEELRERCLVLLDGTACASSDPTAARRASRGVIYVAVFCGSPSSGHVDINVIKLGAQGR